MKKIIPIDENSRIVIEAENYILQFRRKSKKQISWRVDGYFPDLLALAIEFTNSTPRRAEHAISSIEELVRVIKQAESRICQIIINKQYYGRNQQQNLGRNGEDIKKRSS